MFFILFASSLLTIVGCDKTAESSQQSKIEKNSTLQSIKNRGEIICGINDELPGFGFLNKKTGEYSGFDIDICKALSAAIFGDAQKIKFIPLTADKRFEALQASTVDVLIGNTTRTLEREAVFNINFVPIKFYDGQGIMTHKSRKAKTLEDLQGATIGMLERTTTIEHFERKIASKDFYIPTFFTTQNDMFKAYEIGRIDAITSDKSELATRKQMFPDPENHIILDLTLSKEPLAPAVRNDDDQWHNIVSWVIFALFTAEEYNINSANVDLIKSTTKDSRIKELLGVEGNIGELLGLENTWIYNIIKTVGNYEEIYNRNLGPTTKFNIPRGQNNQYNKGGLLYAPPLQ